jgi:aldehyde:ferredoxin oxidoreductase
LISGAPGWDFSVPDFRSSGERIYNLARAYCVREGIDRSKDRLPDRLMMDPLPGGPAEGMVNETEMIEMMKDAYYELRGWDKTNGIPLPEKLRQLNLEEIIPDLWPDYKG